jgi:hypothetical protein
MALMEGSWVRTALVVALLLLIVLLGIPVAMGSIPAPMPCPECDAPAGHAPLLGCAVMLAFLLIFVSAGTGQRPFDLVLRPPQMYSRTLEHPPRAA